MTCAGSNFRNDCDKQQMTTTYSEIRYNEK